MDILWNVNLLKLFFGLITFTMVVFGVLTNICEPYLPVVIVQTFRYGKFASKRQLALLKKFEISKSYFRHFYIVSTLIYSPIVFKEIVWVYVFGGKASGWFETLLDFSCGTSRTATVSSSRVFIAVTLVILQIIRRFFDTHFVSVFSNTATINLFHYVIGMLYYPAVLLAILSEAPNFTHDVMENSTLLADVGITEVGVVILFAWGWYHQHVVTVILAKLRKNSKGDVITQEYKIPTDDWFNYVSSPHLSAEVVMYTALTVLLWRNVTWWYVYAWVLSSQVETMLLSHWWYQSNFKNFPRNRKALIPFVY